MIPAPFSSAVPFSVTLKGFRSMRFSSSAARSAGSPRSAIFWRIQMRLSADWSWEMAMNSETVVE